MNCRSATSCKSDVGSAIREYRAYILGADGHIFNRVELMCDNDPEAVRLAEHLVDTHDVELWQRDRRIARFEGKPEDASGWLKGELKPPN